MSKRNINIELATKAHTNPIIDYNFGRKVELFTGSWISPQKLAMYQDTYPYVPKQVREEPVEPREEYSAIQPIAKRDMRPINNMSSTMPLTLMYDLPFKSHVSYDFEVSDYPNTDEYCVITYNGRKFKVSNFTDKRGLVTADFRRTASKGFLANTEYYISDDEIPF